MYKFCFSLFVLIGHFGFAQDLTIQVGTSPAYCRTAGYQYGNGAIFVAAMGGTPPYVYEIKNLTTGQNCHNTTCIGNPGFYQIQVTDAVNISVVDTVFLDSINPIADFDIISADLNLVDGVFIGVNAAVVSFENKSNVPEFPPPSLVPDSSFLWHFNYGGLGIWQSFEAWDIPDTTYGIGTHEVCLIHQNFNHCRDTACQKIVIYPEGHQGFDLFSDFGNQVLVAVNPDFGPDTQLYIYNVMGQMVLEVPLDDQINTISFNASRGVYVYQYLKNGLPVKRGQFLY